MHVDKFCSDDLQTNMTRGSRGAFIVIEGLDRAGKSTQCSLLAKALKEKSHPVKEMKFPDRTTIIGRMIDSYLNNTRDIDDHSIHLLFSANRWEFSKTMEEQLLNGVTLIVDRYAYSGVAYSCAKPGMDSEWCKQSDVGLPQPDLVMFLELSAEDALRRSGYGEERYEKKEFQSRVSKNFLKLQDDKYWKVINAGRAVETVHQDILSLAESVLKDVKEKDIAKLWSKENSN